MDTKNLDKWAESLLDTGKRNNLMNFKDRRTLTAEIISPSAAELFSRIDGTATFEIYDPKIAEDEEDLDAPPAPEESEEELSPEAMDERTAYLNKYEPKLKRKNQILAYNSQGNALTAIKNIDKKASEFMEETGVNVAYMAFGFVHWTENEHAETSFRAPLLLVPISLEQATALDPYQLHSTEEDIVVNPTFSYKLEADYGIALPAYEDEGLAAYLEKVRKLVSRLHWTVSCECRIGIFSFLKINMYHDLKENAEAILANPNVRILLGESAEKDEVSDAAEGDYHVADPLITLHNVVDADSSQLDAIQMAKSGKSFVLQGPPGTGKSQTITNIIAECLSDGKKVLFVSEKLAALNVVYDKLSKAGLAEFCLELHSHKANKKDVIADICHTLQAQPHTVSSRAEDEIALKEKAMRQLDSYASALHEVRPVIEKSLYQLYEDYASLRSVPNLPWPIPALTTRGKAYLTEACDLLEQYVEYIPSVGYDYHRNPWYGYIGQDLSYQEKSLVREHLTAMAAFLQNFLSTAQNIARRYEISCTSISAARSWLEFFRFASTSRIITPGLLNKDAFTAADKSISHLQELSGEIISLREEINASFLEGIYQLNGAELHQKLTVQFSGAFSHLFNGEYRQLMATLRQHKQDGKKPAYEEAVAVAEQLERYQRKNQEFAQAESPAKAVLGSAYQGVETDWEYVIQQMTALWSLLFTERISMGQLAHCPDFSSEKDTFSACASDLAKCFDACGAEVVDHIAHCFDPKILDVSAVDGQVLLEKCQACLAEFPKLENWCHFRDLLSRINAMQLTLFINTAIGQNAEARYLPKMFRKQFIYQWIDCILSSDPVLSGFNRISQDKSARTFREKDKEQFEINKAKIRETLSALRPSTDMAAGGSALSMLLREGQKKRRQKSIRALLAEAGELVQRIKPCFLMSPLSVSTFLAPGAVQFDVVVFDEASQIFPQDAVGAIYRARQLIVVGDCKQMPPSNFFNSMLEGRNDDEESGDVTDFESILDLCSAPMQQLRLRWHYRSRYEQLIAFSNKNFYDGDLITFPSSQKDQRGIGVDYYHADGVFDRKTHVNRKEAEFIVDLIYENIEKFPQRSLGVVAFSASQQDLIDKVLSKRRQVTPEKEDFFSKNVPEPFFVKNLETVQGDERDTIIFSVAYGKDAQGKLLHNFGPLNKTGGERRLNVAVTRAKCNVQLVSSMHYTDIDLTRVSSDGPRLLREYLDFAENGDAALQRTVTANADDHFDSDFEMEVCDFLRAKGFTVDTQVGCSGFRIDLGLRLPNSSNYVLAIECDGAAYHSSRNARDRDRLRQEILERMGWKFYRIWSTDWFRNKALAQEQLLEAATVALKSPRSEELQAPAQHSAASFEEAPVKKAFSFPEYKSADIDALSRDYFPQDFRGMVKKILEVEAPLSEGLLLRRIVGLFGRAKVTSVVQREYERLMYDCQRFGILRRDGFLYLEGVSEYYFRAPGQVPRDMKQISPEELAAGMLEILRQNLFADKAGLYHALAAQCGVTRVGRAINEQFDNALALLQDKVLIDGDQLTLR